MRESARLGRDRNMIFTKIVVIAACTCAASSIAAAATKAQYHFQFNPPSGTTIITTYKFTKTTTNGPNNTRVDATTGKEQTTIDKTDSGFTAVCKILSMDATRNGKKLSPEQEAAVHVFDQSQLTYKLDTSGRLVSIDDAGQLQESLDKMLKTLHQDPNAELWKSIKQATMDNITKEWNNRIVEYVGKTAESGDVWMSQGDMATPFGSINVSTKTYFGDPVTVDGRKCVKLGFVYAADVASAKQFITKLMESIKESAKADYPTPKVISATVIGKGYRIVDPSTMLSYGEESHRTLKLTLSVPDGGEREVTSDESRVYSFDYPKESR